MSSNGDAASSRNSQQTPAIDVSFSRIADQYGESSSRADSRSSAGRRSDLDKGNKLHKDPAPETPPRASRQSRHDGRYSLKSNGQRPKRSAGGFLLDSVLSSGRNTRSPEGSDKSNGKRREQDVDLSVDKRRSVHSNRFSLDSSSMRSSPLSREVRSDESWSGQTQTEHASQRPPSMDPAQLVQMALSLSEGRKRHVSNSLRVPLPTAGTERRAVTGEEALTGTVRANPAAKQRVLAAHDRSPTPGLTSNVGLQYHDSDLYDRSVGAPEAEDDDDMLHTFSSATLSRAEKARRHFELANEHRRLLQFLPPLKPDANAPGNYKYSSNSTPGSVHPSITRMRSNTGSKYELGRKYNPLQALRNRRLRQRERRGLTVPSENWQDLDAVKTYVNTLETEAKHTSYRRAQDRVALPLFPGDDEESHFTTDSVSGSRRRDTVNSIITRRNNDWFVDPAEQLADAYWTEKGDNKSLLEDRRSQPLFPDGRPQSFEKSRRSVENMRQSQDLPRTLNENIDMPLPDREASDSGSNKKRRKHRLRLSVHAPDHVRRRKRLGKMRSASVSSNDSMESRNAKLMRFGSDFENTGPLEKHMAEMIAKDQRGELSSPELVSPDRWEPHHPQFPVMRNRADSVSKRRSHHHRNGSLDVPNSHGHKRSKSADGRTDGKIGRSSIEEESPTEAAPPMGQSLMPSFARDISSPSKKSDKGKSKLRKHFRSGSKERNAIEHTDFAEPGEGERLREISNIVADKPRFSFDSLRPLPVQRHKTSDSMSSSLRQVNTKDSSSTVGRMLRGAKFGGLKRTDSRFRYKDKFGEVGSTIASSNVSDAEGRSSFDGERRQRPGTASTADSELSPRQSLEGMNRFNLPSFQQVARGRGSDTPKSSGSDPISRQQSAQRKQGRSERFDRLAPRIVLPDGASNRSQASFARSDNGGFASRHASARSSKVSLGRHNERLRDGDVLPMSGLSREGTGHRDWSISNQNLAAQHMRITMHDVARSRTLLLASGVKAREILRLGEQPRDSKWPDFAKAIETAGEDPGPVARKDEPGVTARLLRRKLSTELADFETSIEHFHRETATALVDRLDDLKHKAADRLTNVCHETSDEADAFMAQLATQFTMDVKNTDDSIDFMFRRRRRQFRLLRRTGFKLLEWAVLGLMWWIWFAVVVFNLCKKLVVDVLSFLRWLLWF